MNLKPIIWNGSVQVKLDVRTAQMKLRSGYQNTNHKLEIVIEYFAQASLSFHVEYQNQSRTPYIVLNRDFLLRHLFEIQICLFLK